MATPETNTACKQGEQKGNMLTPSEEDGSPVSNENVPPLNFSELTPCQFGISSQSFVPSSSNRKSKSRLAQIKERRRSNIGARGSPETNSLIRFMAQQRMKTPQAQQSLEHDRSSPLLPRVASTLRQKMASFQSLMDVKETEVCDPMPRRDSDGGGCIKTRDYLSDGNSFHKGKENSSPMMTPLPSKRRCLGPLEGCEVEIREASAPILHFPLKEQEESTEQVLHGLTEGPVSSIHNVEDAQAVFDSAPLRLDFDSGSPKKQQDCAELQSPSRTPTDDPATISITQLASPFHISSLSLLEMEPKVTSTSTGTTTVKEKKRVRFGGPLSPELFDKNLPPSTPLQKGATPARAPTPGGALRSALKTPQRNDGQTPSTQPDLISPTVFGASPELALPRNSRISSTGKDSEHNGEKVVFTMLEDTDSLVASGTDNIWDAQPLNLNTAFYEESLSEMVKEQGTKFSANPQMDVLDEQAAPLEEARLEAGAKAAAPVKSRKRKLPELNDETKSAAPSRPVSRKKKLEQKEPVKRLTRSAAVSACGKMKTTTSTRRWNKEVDRSLYGSRAFASKNPVLSPITERLSFFSSSPATQQDPSSTLTGVTDQKTCLNLEMDNTTEVAEHTTTNALESLPEVSETPARETKTGATGKDEEPAGIKVEGRRLKKTIVAACDVIDEESFQHTGGDTLEDLQKGQTTTDLEASNEIQMEDTVPEQEGNIIEPSGQMSADELGNESERTAGCPPPGEEPGHTPAKRKRGRRSSLKSSTTQEQGDKLENHQLNCVFGEKEQEEPASSSHESRSASDSQEDEGVSTMHLAPWQADFNFEDVFKPIPTRGQRSVRRSLRNLSNVAQSNNCAGLAWMPRTSPDSRQEPRRRTRGRRHTAVLPVQPSFSEESQTS